MILLNLPNACVLGFRMNNQQQREHDLTEKENLAFQLFVESYSTVGEADSGKWSCSLGTCRKARKQM